MNSVYNYIYIYNQSYNTIEINIINKYLTMKS